MSEGDCLFCKMVVGDIPVTRLYDDDLVMAFSDIAPRAPTHILIIPKQHIVSANELSDDHDLLLSRLFAAARRIAAELGLGERGYRLTFNVGPEGGQTIYHLHLHLLGGRQMGAEG
jgi:histidine triad (HIT) family protein